MKDYSDLPTINQESCNDCGACCMNVSLPPFWSYDNCDYDFQRLPNHLKREVMSYLDENHTAKNLGQPCIWFDAATRLCKHYDHRPFCCREFRPGSEVCLDDRKQRGIDRPLITLVVTLLLIAAPALSAFGQSPQATSPAANSIGAQGRVGCLTNPRRMQRLSIDRPGVYENLLIDGEWIESTLVKVTADNVTLRNCEIRHGKHNAVTVSAKNVVIESCKIHHVLRGTYDDQQDAHGITGRPENLTIRNCDIGLTSGDSIQFDPGRGPWDNVLIENCTLWTGPLPADAAGFNRGQRPGENGLDTKQSAANTRSRVTVRNCYLFGWNQPAQISNMAALNLKNHVQVQVENCLFSDNEICFRVRGGTDEYGGALVTIDNCAAYNSKVAVRAESGIRDLKIRRLGLGPRAGARLVSAGGGPGPGFEDTGKFQPPPLELALKNGLPR